VIAMDTILVVNAGSNAVAKSIVQRGLKVAGMDASRLDSFIASLRDARRQI
jgi:hypothetical protein